MYDVTAAILEFQNRNGGHLGVPKQRIGGHIDVPNQSFGN